MGSIKRVTINKGNGGVGGQLPGKDHISGLLYEISTLPTVGAGQTSWTDAPIKKLLSLQDAINVGINDSHSEETKATGGQYLITTAGVLGETWYLYCEPISGTKILIGSYTVKSGDAVADVASGLVDSINLGTNNTGFKATLDTATVQLIAPDKYGASLNTESTVLTYEVYTSNNLAGTGVSTVTQFSGGTGDENAVLYYHIQQAFAYNPQLVLYVGLYTSYDSSKIEDMQSFANGDIRQSGIYTKTTYAASLVSTLQINGESMNDIDRPMSMVLTSDLSATTASALTDTRTIISATKEAFVSVDCGETNVGEGKRLSGVVGRSIGMVGAIIGILSIAKVHQCIGAVQYFDLTSGTEFLGEDGAGLSTGESVKDLSNNLVEQLNNYGYLFPVKYDGEAGTFINDSHTATQTTNDYNAIERVRTIDKAGRNVKTALTPLINSELYVDAATGQLDGATIAKFKGEALNAIETMAKDGEVSTQEDGSLPDETVVIDPNQDVLSTGEIVVTVSIVPVGVARAITVNLKFVKSV